MCLSPALLLILAHAFIPIDRFIHRGDDAYYYFRIAANYPLTGVWSFDRIHPTNGVQPLWAFILTALAQMLAWLGITDLNVLARIFVALAALLHFAFCIVLFDLIARKVSTLSGIAVAGAFLYPMGIVWSHVWGMETSLYALMLVLSVHYFHIHFLGRETHRRAAILGLLLGGTALSRLNACLFIWIILIHYVIRRKSGLPVRLQRAALTLFVAGTVIVPYFVWNYLSTEHLLPISGAAKSASLGTFLEHHGVESVFSIRFVEMLLRVSRIPLWWFVSSRYADGFWLAGSRVAFSGNSGVSLIYVLLPATALFIAAPLLFDRRMQWLRFLKKRMFCLGQFVYLPIFGAVNALISVTLYPHQIGYAMIRWWWVENELVLTVISAVLAAASIGYLARRVLPAPRRLVAMAGLLTTLFAAHSCQMSQNYWSEKYVSYDWRRSRANENYLAAKWLSEHVPEDALVGSWNAGVVGYYAKQRVINLDGLINSFDILPYIDMNRIDLYIRKEGIQYISDGEPMMIRHHLRERLKMTEVYRHRSESSPWGYYVIYRVDE